MWEGARGNKTQRYRDYRLRRSTSQQLHAQHRQQRRQGGWSIGQAVSKSVARISPAAAGVDIEAAVNINILDRRLCNDADSGRTSRHAADRQQWRSCNYFDVWLFATSADFAAVAARKTAPLRAIVGAGTRLMRLLLLETDGKWIRQTFPTYGLFRLTWKFFLQINSSSAAR